MTLRGGGGGGGRVSVTTTLIFFKIVWMCPLSITTKASLKWFCSVVVVSDSPAARVFMFVAISKWGLYNCNCAPGPALALPHALCQFGRSCASS